MKVKITRGKFEGMNACANERGVIAALAVDHRGNLMQAIAESQGLDGQATAADMLAFKTAVTYVLTPYASAVLLDAEYGLGAIASRAPGTGVMLAYEKSGYDINTKGRLPDLLPEQSVRRLFRPVPRPSKFCLTITHLMTRGSTGSSRPMSNVSELSVLPWTYHFSLSRWYMTTHLVMRRDWHLPGRSQNMFFAQ